MVTEQVVYRPSYKHFLPAFTNIKLKNDTLCYLDLFTHIYALALNLSYTDVTDADMSALGNVHALALNLSYTKVKDAFALGNIHTLNLKCTNVTNVVPYLSYIPSIRSKYITNDHIDIFSKKIGKWKIDKYVIYDNVFFDSYLSKYYHPD